MNFFGTVSFSTLENTMADVKSALTHTKVVHLRGIPDDIDKRVYFEKLADSLGKYYDVDEDLETGKIQEGRWIEIAYDPTQPNRYRSSNTRQPLHTDASYYPIENNIQYFYCASHASMGGATTFIDLPELIAAMKLDGREELLNRLLTVPVCFSKFVRRKTRPILMQEGDGWRINYNYYCGDPDNTPEAKQLIQDFFDFLETRIQPSGIISPLELKIGEAVFFNDERVMHGRNAFFATTPGERKLVKGTIIEWQ